MYLTYEEYKKYGGLLSESAFFDLCFEAAIKIDYYTFGRLKKDTAFSENVKRAVYKIICCIDTFNRYKAIVTDIEHPVTESQSNDGVSVSYGGYIGNTTPQDVNTVTKQYEKDICKIIIQYLSGERNQSGKLLLYRGVC